MPNGTAKELVRQFYDLINTGQTARADALIAPDFTDHPGVPGLPPGRDGLLQFVAMARAAFPDLHVAVEDLIAEGDRVAARVVVSGTQRGVFLGAIPPTGKHVTWTGIDLFRIASGRIAERWNERDLLGLMEQLGAVTRRA
ncbi:MAG TPA: ester cyclase [bacterium]|nr:ester cyclase [bacterium]